MTEGSYIGEGQLYQRRRVEAGPLIGSGPPFGVGLVLSGFATIAAFLGGLVVWSLVAPIESAVVAPGVISVGSSVRTIQHLEGGIVDAILIREGDHVAAGDVLIRLRNTVPVSVLNEVQAQYFEARATEARLLAERDSLTSIEIPAELRNKVADQAVQEAIAGQQSIFESRRNLVREQRAILNRTMSGADDEVRGLEGQIQALERQEALIDEELKSALELLRKGLMDKPRVLGLQRDKAVIGGQISSYRASIAASRQAAEEAQLKSAELEATTVTEVVDQLRQARSSAYELSQKLAAAQDVLGRTEIRAPIEGTVVGMKVHTLGGVISAGEPLLDIVPINDELVVQASIDPMDIDQVKVGLPASVQLSGISRRNQTLLEGELKTVSADRLTDPVTGFAYYLARVELRTDSPEFKSVTLQPGMSADVMIRTGARTPWEYLVTPITRSLRRSLREE